MLDYLGHLRGTRNQRPGSHHGQPLSDSRTAALMTAVEPFWAFMHETATAPLPAARNNRNGDEPNSASLLVPCSVSVPAGWTCAMLPTA
jgi:hypothetical protein